VVLSLQHILTTLFHYLFTHASNIDLRCLTSGTKPSLPKSTFNRRK